MTGSALEMGRYYRETISQLDRASGGKVRAVKGALVETLAEDLVRLAWASLQRPADDLDFTKRTYPIPVRDPERYAKRIADPDARRWFRENVGSCVYKAKADVHVRVRGELRLAIECKAYTENAMFKRILVDFAMLREAVPDVRCALVQLESQLGGDYSDLGITHPRGSPSTHVLQSRFDVEIEILTLLAGERKVDHPIHNPEYFKPLTEAAVVNAADRLSRLLE